MTKVRISFYPFFVIRPCLTLNPTLLSAQNIAKKYQNSDLNCHSCLYEKLKEKIPLLILITVAPVRRGLWPCYFLRSRLIFPQNAKFCDESLSRLLNSDFTLHIYWGKQKTNRSLTSFFLYQMQKEKSFHYSQKTTHMLNFYWSNFDTFTFIQVLILSTFDTGLIVVTIHYCCLFIPNLWYFIDNATAWNPEAQCQWNLDSLR